MKQTNPECKKCGFLQSTVEATKVGCLKKSPEHDFGDSKPVEKRNILSDLDPETARELIASGKVTAVEKCKHGLQEVLCRKCKPEFWSEPTQPYKCDCKTKYCKHYKSDFDKFVEENPLRNGLPDICGNCKVPLNVVDKYTRCCPMCKLCFSILGNPTQPEKLPANSTEIRSKLADTQPESWAKDFDKLIKNEKISFIKEWPRTAATIPLPYQDIKTYPADLIKSFISSVVEEVRKEQKKDCIQALKEYLPEKIPTRESDEFDAGLAFNKETALNLLDNL